jgi:prepilin-type N-terminal cleavage/methylation domain-containing protein
MRSRGFTLVELIIVICVVAVTFGIALERLLKYQELAERTAVEQTIAAINTALMSKFGAYLGAGRADSIRADAGTNPVHLLVRPPARYLGELYAPDTAMLERQSWYFDRQSGEFVYLPQRRRYLSVEEGTPDRVRFKIFVSEPKAENGLVRELAMPFIAPAAPFQWVID